MNVKSVTCATKGCGYSPFPMEVGHYQRATRTHESFKCPQGHDNFFASESDLEALERKNRTLCKDNQRLSRIIDEQVGRCPWILCVFEAQDRQGLRTHMRARHGMPTLAAVEEVA